MWRKLSRLATGDCRRRMTHTNADSDSPALSLAAAISMLPHPRSALFRPSLTVDKIAGYVRWHKVVAANEMHRSQWELWVTSDGNGFQIVRFTDTFKAAHGDLAEDSGDQPSSNHS